MRTILSVLCLTVSLAIATGCEDSITNTQGANLQSDVGVVQFVNDANRDGVILEVITERRLLIADDCVVMVQRPDYSGFSNTGLWQLSAGQTVRYEYLMEEICYVAPDYSEYVVHKLYIYANGFPNMPEPTEEDD